MTTSPLPGFPTLEHTLASLASSVPGVELLVTRVVGARPLEVELIGGDGRGLGRRRVNRSALRAVIESGATLVAPDVIDPDPLLWLWNGGPAARAVAVPASSPTAEGLSTGAVIAWRPDGPLFDRDELERVEDLARVVGAVLASDGDEPGDGNPEAPRPPTDTDPVSGIVHELRTPLTVVDGYVSMLRDGSLGPMSDPVTRVLDVIAAKTEEARTLVDELLLVGRLEAERIVPNVEVLDLVEEARRAAGRARPRGAMLGAAIIVTEPSGPVEVCGDRRLIARVLDNLVNNALLYSSASPRIELAVARERGGGVLHVADNGLGIRAAMQDRVFEKFVRADERGTRAGTGLGLYLGRQIAERLGGSLLLERSDPGVGSVFALRLPAPD